MDKTAIIDSLKVLGLKIHAQNVLLYLIKHDVSPAAEIASGLNLPKSTVYDALNELLSNSLITEFNQDRSKQFGVIDVDRLGRVSENKINELKAAQESLLGYIKGTIKTKSVARPKIKFYAGHEGIRQAFRDTMWHDRCKETYLMWPTKEMVDILGQEFSAWHSSLRLKHKVMMYAIRTHADRDWEKVPGDSELFDTPGWKNDRKIRYAPKNLKWDMSYWIYDDKCLFASGGTEKFGFIVHSKEFSNLMQTLFSQMWKVCLEK
jgi:sugar-specific transcriptional regulator TrmB